MRCAVSHTVAPMPRTDQPKAAKAAVLSRPVGEKATHSGKTTPAPTTVTSTGASQAGRTLRTTAHEYFAITCKDDRTDSKTEQNDRGLDTRSGYQNRGLQTPATGFVTEMEAWPDPDDDAPRYGDPDENQVSNDLHQARPMALAVPPSSPHVATSLTGKPVCPIPHPGVSPSQFERFTRSTRAGMPTACQIAVIASPTLPYRAERQRLKHSGMRWTVAGATLRCQQASRPEDRICRALRNQIPAA